MGRGIGRDSGQSAPTTATIPARAPAATIGRSQVCDVRQRNERRDGRERRERNQPAAHLVADQHPGEHAVECRVHHRSKLKKRLHTARDGAHLPGVLTAQRVGARHVRYRVIYGHGAESVRSRGQRRCEVAAQVGRQRDPVQVGAHCITAPGGSDDAARACFQRPKTHLELDVSPFDGIRGRRRRSPRSHPVPRRHPPWNRRVERPSGGRRSDEAGSTRRN